MLTASAPACVNLTGATTFAGAGSGSQIDTANVTVINNYGPNDAAQDWYMMADFSACTTADSVSRTLRTFGVQS